MVTDFSTDNSIRNKSRSEEKYEQFTIESKNDENLDFWETSAPPSKGSSSSYTNDAERRQSVAKTTLSSRPKIDQVDSFAIKVISKKWFPSASIQIGFTNPTTGVYHKIKINQVLRSFSAEDDSGSKVGKIKMKGFTIYSGAGGNITLSDGGVFKVDMKTSLFGINKKTFTLTDLSNGMVFRTL